MKINLHTITDTPSFPVLIVDTKQALYIKVNKLGRAFDDGQNDGAGVLASYVCEWTPMIVSMQRRTHLYRDLPLVV